MTNNISKILANYDSESPGIRANLYRILSQGVTGGTGRLLILPVDQGFEHGPDKSFACNSDAYDPHYHYKLAIDAGLSAYAAPVGFIEAGAGIFAGQIPTILKLNSNNALMPGASSPDQAITASPHDALRLGCSGVGLTIYPGSHKSLDMIEEAAKISALAKSLGLVVVIWCYPRGDSLSKAGETSIDTIAYAAHMACLLGAHIVKVKLPDAYIEKKDIATIYQEHNVDASTTSSRVEHIVKSCFNGKRLVVFSGGAAKDMDDIILDAKAIAEAGGNGLIIGRNSFQRKREDALALLGAVSKIFCEIK